MGKVDLYIFKIIALQPDLFIMCLSQLKQEGSKLVRLWIHEVYRVFSDRLIEDEDKLAFFEIVKARTRDFFQKSVDEVNV